MDIDPDALNIAQENLHDFELNTMDLVLGDLTVGEERLPAAPLFDTVVMNPPFGTKLKGADMLFLRTALRLSKNAVYSLHKTSTRDHILKKAKDWGVSCDVIAEMRYDLPASYKMHKKASLDIQVDFIRFAHPSPPRASAS